MTVKELEMSLNDIKNKQINAFAYTVVACIAFAFLCVLTGLEDWDKASFVCVMCFLIAGFAGVLIEMSLSDKADSVREDFDLQYRAIHPDAVRAYNKLARFKHQYARTRKPEQWNDMEKELLVEYPFVLMSLLNYKALDTVFLKSGLEQEEQFLDLIREGLDSLADKGVFGSRLEGMKPSDERNYQIRQYIYDNAEAIIRETELKVRLLAENLCRLLAENL